MENVKKIITKKIEGKKVHFIFKNNEVEKNEFANHPKRKSNQMICKNFINHF